MQIHQSVMNSQKININMKYTLTSTSNDQLNDQNICKPFVRTASNVKNDDNQGFFFFCTNKVNHVTKQSNSAVPWHTVTLNCYTEAVSMTDGTYKCCEWKHTSLHS